MKKSPFEVMVIFGKGTAITFSYVSERAQHEASESFLAHPAIRGVTCYGPGQSKVLPGAALQTIVA